MVFHVVSFTVHLATLEKVALDGSVASSSAVSLCRDGVTFDLLTQKRNQVICVPRCTSDKSLANENLSIDTGDIVET